MRPHHFINYIDDLIFTRELDEVAAGVNAAFQSSNPIGFSAGGRRPG
ncbi:hypothetical protein [Xanthobacter versatilis]